MAKKVAVFHIRLKEALSKRSMTQQDLAEKTNINKGNISLYVNGLRTPKIDKIEEFADVLNVSTSWLMGYDVPMLYNENDGLLNEIIKKVSLMSYDKLEKLNILIDTLFK